jgi:ABC-type nitrate/sulfonate/bicarbonate transport system substrate-binding protein
VDVKKRAEKFVKDNPELVNAYIHALQQAQKVAQNAASLEKVATDAALLNAAA